LVICLLLLVKKKKKKKKTSLLAGEMDRSIKDHTIGDTPYDITWLQKIMHCSLL
jgi:hypothetical protein